MSQTDLVVSNDTGANVRADINAQLQALGSLMAGTSAPGTTYAGMFWLDTTNHLLKRRNEANNAWITAAKFDETNGLTSPYAWNAVIDDAFETLASSSTTNLATPVSRNVTITGTTTITAFGTVKSGSVRHLRFEDALTLTHNGASLILPGAANITTAANDTATFISLGSGNWLCLEYKRSSGLPVLGQTNLVQRAYTSTAAVATGTTVMPDDDSIPQNTEGDEYITLAITPTSATNRLRITVKAHLSQSAGNHGVYALFQDSTAGALAAGMYYNVSNTRLALAELIFEMVAGTTSATTFKFRAGPSAAGTMTINGESGARLLGGVCNSVMMIEEIRP